MRACTYVRTHVKYVVLYACAWTSCLYTVTQPTLKRANDTFHSSRTRQTSRCGCVWNGFPRQPVVAFFHLNYRVISTQLIKLRHWQPGRAEECSLNFLLAKMGMITVNWMVPVLSNKDCNERLLSTDALGAPGTISVFRFGERAKTWTDGAVKESCAPF